jgi:DHA3 family macrolide efflux protein-like MFS transporter
MREGIHIVLHNKGLSWIFLFSALTFFFMMPVSVLFPLMTLDYFGGNAFQVSLIEVLWGAGALAGGMAMGAKVYKVNKVMLINCMYLILGITFLFSGVLSSSGFVFFAILTTIAGVSGTVYQSAFTGIVQTHIDPAILGRVFSMFFSVSLIPSLIGLLGIGFFADNLGITTSFVVCGAAIIVIGILSFMTPSSLKIDKRHKS